MKGYHGTTIGRAHKFLSALYEGKTRYNAIRKAFESALRYPYGLYVTATWELAARYANAHATRVVNPDATTPSVHTCMITIEMPTGQDFHWRDPDYDASLDICEAWVSLRDLQIVDIALIECDYKYCTCHEEARHIRIMLNKEQKHERKRANRNMRPAW